MNYIGVDCHISSLDFAVVNEKGTTTKRQRVNTSVKELVGFIKSVPKPRKIFIEEGNGQLAVRDLYGLWRETDCHRSQKESVDWPIWGKE